jgi:hypothetical protein
LFASAKRAAALGEFMRERGVLINASPIVRLVTHLDVNRQQLPRWSSHWQAFLNVKESGVSQRILVLGASGYIGQHLVQAKRAGLHRAGGGTPSTGCKNSICPASPAIRSI